MPRLPAFDPIEYLTIRKFGSPSQWKQNKCGQPSPDRHWLSGDEPRVDPPEVKFYRKELMALANSEIDRRVALERIAETEEAEANHRFNKPPAVADRSVFEHWSKAAYWHVGEAAALLIGRDPKHLNATKIKNDTIPTKTKEKFSDIRELLDRAITARQIDLAKGPAGMLAWAKRSGISCPEELEDCVRQFSGELRDWRSVAEELQRENAVLNAKIAELSSEAPKSGDNLAVRERTSMLKLIIGMAIEGYRFDPKAPRNPSTADIASDLAKVGLPLDDATILKYLREAADLLPGDGTD